MNSFNQSNLNERDINYNNQISINKSEKFQDSINNMRLRMWNKFLGGVASNPHMSKKEICHDMGLKVGTINSIQQHYKLQSPFYFKKQKVHRKKNQNEKFNEKKQVKSKNKKGGYEGGNSSESNVKKVMENLRINPV